MKQILVLGGNGRTGKLVVDYALEKGYKVVALVRNLSKVVNAGENVTYVEGTPYQLEDVKNAIKGCDAVISTLNNSRKSDWPWSEPDGPFNILERSMLNVSKAMQEEGIDRIVYMSALGVRDSEQYMPVMFKTIVKYSSIKIVYDDHSHAESVLEGADLNWTFIRPVGLTNGTKPNPVAIISKGKPEHTTVRRIAVAKFMVEALDKDKYYRKALMMADKK